MPDSSAPAPAFSALHEGHLRRLLHLSQEFNSTIDLDALLPRVLDLVIDTVDAEAGSLWLLDGEILSCHVARGATANVLQGLELPLGAGIVGDAVLKGECMMVNEVTDDPRFLHQIDQLAEFQTQSVIAVPLVTRGETVGAIEVVNERTGDGTFTEDQRLFLEALSDDAAAAIRNARLFHAEKQARDLAALLEVSHEITSTLDLERVLLSIVNLAGRAVRFDRCILALWSDDELRIRAISGEEKVDRKNPDVREIERFLSWGASRGEEIHVADVADLDDEVAREARKTFASYLEASGARGFFLIPVSDSEGRLGILHFEFADPDRLNEWSRKAAILLANEAALALRNAQLYASVPFISWLEPLAERRRALAGLPRATWLKYGLAVTAIFLILTFFKIPLRLSATDASVRAAVQQPARSGMGGIIEAVWVEEGERVEAGTPLVRVRDEDLLRRYRQAEADLDLATRQLRAADARGDATTTAQARVRAAELADALRIFTTQLEQSQVLAPTAGVVLTPRLHELVGSYVGDGSPVLWIGDPQVVEIELRIDQADMGDIRVGNRVRAKVSAHPSVIFEGTVSAIAPRAEAPTTGSPTYAVRALLDNGEQLLSPGMSARAKVVTDARPLATFLFRRPWRWVRMLVWW